MSLATCEGQRERCKSAHRGEMHVRDLYHNPLKVRFPN